MRHRGYLGRCFGRLGLAGLLAAAPGLLRAQEAGKPERGFQPARTYTVSEVETINIINGNLIYEIPLASLPPGRGGMSLGVKLLYNSALYNTQRSWEGEGYGWHMRDRMVLNPYSQGGSGWQFGYEYRLIEERRPTPWTVDGDGHLIQDTSCSNPGNIYVYRLSAQLPDGSLHPLVLWTTEGLDRDAADSYYFRYSMQGQSMPCVAGQSPAPDPPATLVYYSVDGSFLRVEVERDTGRWAIYLPDGTKASSGELGASDAVRIEDRNGNAVQVCQEYESGIYTTRLVEVLDRGTPTPCDINATPAPRYVEIYDPLTGSKVVKAKSTNWVSESNPKPEDLHWTLEWGVEELPLNPYECERHPGTGQILATCLLSRESAPDNPLPLLISTLRYVELPDGRRYTFGYDVAGGGWGEMNTVTHPSGLVATYQYQQHGYGRIYDEVLYNPVVGKQWALASDPSQQWSYAYPTRSQTQITNPDGGEPVGAEAHQL